MPPSQVSRRRLKLAVSHPPDPEKNSEAEEADEPDEEDDHVEEPDEDVNETDDEEVDAD